MPFMIGIPFRIRVEHAGIGYKGISCPAWKYDCFKKNGVLIYACLCTGNRHQWVLSRVKRRAEHTRGRKAAWTSISPSHNAQGCVIWPWSSCSRNDREKLLPTWWVWLSDGCSKCGIYGFLHFFSPWWTSRGDCPLCWGFCGPCLVWAPCTEMWHMVWRRHFTPLQAQRAWWWLHLCKLLQPSLNSLPEQVCTQAIHLICSPCISCDTL